MSDSLLLYLIFLLLYISESIYLFSNNASLLLENSLFKIIFKPGKELPQFNKQHLYFHNPLNPLSTFYAAYDFPLAISPESISEIEIHSKIKDLKFNDITSLKYTGDLLYINKKRLKFPSSYAAIYYYKLLDEMRTVNEEKRDRIIYRHIENSLNIEHEIEKLDKIFSKTLLMKLLTGVLFLFLVIALPLVIKFFELDKTWPYLLSFYLVVATSLIALFYRTHRYFLKSETYQRWTVILTMLVYPPMALHSLKMITKSIHNLSHPVAVGLALFERDSVGIKELLGHYLRLYRYGIESKHIDGSSEAIQWHFEKLLDTVESFCNRYAINPNDLGKPDIAENDNSQSYCPLCHCTYEINKGRCSDCQIELKAIE